MIPLEIDCVRSQFQEIILSKRSVLLFGFGFIGRHVFHALRQNGVPIQAIIDNDTEKQGMKYEGVPILPPLSFLGSDVPVVIGIKGNYRPILQELNSLRLEHIIPHSFPLTLDHTIPFSSPLTWGSDSRSKQSFLKLDMIHFSNAARQLKLKESERLTLRSVDLVVTEKCSLRCADCSNLMQYFAAPRHADFGQAIKSLDTLMGAVDFVEELRLLGGEPFINPELDGYVKYTLSYRNVGAIVLYTNGTVIPTETQMRALKHEKIFVVISDYGDASRKADEMANVLWEHGISAIMQHIETWQDCALLRCYGRTAEENRKIFQSCCMRNTPSVKDGKLFRCPFASNVAALRAVPPELNQYVELINPIESANLIQGVKGLMGLSVLKVCDYCGGRPNNAFTIPAARQAPHPLSYTRFEEERACG